MQSAFRMPRERLLSHINALDQRSVRRRTACVRAAADDPWIVADRLFFLTVHFEGPDELEEPLMRYVPDTTPLSLTASDATAATLTLAADATPLAPLHR